MFTIKIGDVREDFRKPSRLNFVKGGVREKWKGVRSRNIQVSSVGDLNCAESWKKRVQSLSEYFLD